MFTRVSAAGPIVACGREYSIAWQPMRIINTRCSTAPLSGRISTAPVRQKKSDEQAIGRSRGGLSTKINALVDAIGNPLAFHLTGGHAHDLDGADVLLPGMTADTLLADKAYDADERVLQKLEEAGKTAVIPPKANRVTPREHDKDTYKARHLIENFVCKLKLYRAIATRYDKTARNFLAAICGRRRRRAMRCGSRRRPASRRRSTSLTSRPSSATSPAWCAKSGCSR